MRPIAVIALVALLAGCSNGDAETFADPVEGVVLRVVADGQVARDWTLAELEEALAFTELDINGDTQSGPLLLDVLRVSGVEQWDSAEVLGMSEGRVIEVSLEVDSDQVDQSWILDVSNRGTLKLATPNLSRERWVRDIGEIRIP